MKIYFLGYSSFLIETSNRKLILTDPLGPYEENEIFDEAVDIITISHYHQGRKNTSTINQFTKILDTIDDYEDNDVKIKGFPSFCDKIRGAKRGNNIIFTFEADGYKLCHLGGLGHLLSTEEIDLLGRIDVLMIPVGGNFTIDSQEAYTLVKEINPKIILPMSFKTSSTLYPLQGVEKFIQKIKIGEKLASNYLEIDSPLEGFNKVKLFTLSHNH